MPSFILVVITVGVRNSETLQIAKLKYNKYMSANFKIMEDFNMNEIYEGIMNLYFILNRDGPTWVGGGRRVSLPPLTMLGESKTSL